MTGSGFDLSPSEYEGGAKNIMPQCITIMSISMANSVCSSFDDNTKNFTVSSLLLSYLPIYIQYSYHIQSLRHLTYSLEGRVDHCNEYWPMQGNTEQQLHTKFQMELILQEDHEIVLILFNFCHFLLPQIHISVSEFFLICAQHIYD
jgi:hypothetical protein